MHAADAMRVIVLPDIGNEHELGIGPGGGSEPKLAMLPGAAAGELDVLDGIGQMLESLK